MRFHGPAGRSTEEHLATTAILPERREPTLLDRVLTAVIRDAVNEAAAGDPVMIAWIFDRPPAGTRYRARFEDVCTFLGAPTAALHRRIR